MRALPLGNCNCFSKKKENLTEILKKSPEPVISIKLDANHPYVKGI
jgi:hypothetical protein